MWSDIESNDDYLNFGEISSIVTNILNSPSMLPVSIGIFGNWGAGKSTLLRLIEKEITVNNSDKKKLVINFDAWLYQGYDDARAALLETIATKLHKAAKGNEKLIDKTLNLLKRVDAVRSLGLLVEGGLFAAGIPTFGLVSKSLNVVNNVFDGIQDENEYKAITEVGTDLVKTGKSLLKPEKKYTPPQQINAFRQEYSAILQELNITLIVNIDNLDRCLPVNAIHTLESIRLFLFLPNTAFIIAADEGMIRASVAEHFKGASERHHIDYLDKLIQVPIRVPTVGLLEIRSYLFMLYAQDYNLPKDKLELLRKTLEQNLQESWRSKAISKEDALNILEQNLNSDIARSYDLVDRISPLLVNSPIIHGNPRIVKRLLNVVKMRVQIAKRRGIPLDENIITKLVIFERCMNEYATNDLYNLINSIEKYKLVFQSLEDNHNQEFHPNTPQSWSKDESTKEFIKTWSKLEPSLYDKDLTAATYLSRETILTSIYNNNLSPKAREVLDILLSTDKTSSLAAKKALDTLSFDEHVPIMEALVNSLRKITEWNKRPRGYAGACLLAEKSSSAADILRRFIDGLVEKARWMETDLKNREWYKEK